MQQFGFVVNTRWKLAICLDCKCGVDSKGLYAHINRHISPQRVTHEYCKSVITEYGLSTRYGLKIPTSVVPAIFGLAVIPDMYYCSKCGYAACHRRTVVRHHNRGQPCPNSDILCGPAQSFFPKARINFFGVRIPLPRPTEPSKVLISTLFKAQVAPTQATSLITIPSDTRDMHHFLSLGDWFEEVNGLTGDQAYSITREALPDLRSLVRQSINLYIDSMNEELSGVDFAIKVAMGDYNQ